MSDGFAGRLKEKILVNIGSDYYSRPVCFNKQKEAVKQKFLNCPACKHVSKCKCENKGDNREAE